MIWISIRYTSLHIHHLPIPLAFVLPCSSIIEAGSVPEVGQPPYPSFTTSTRPSTVSGDRLRSVWLWPTNSNRVLQNQQLMISVLIIHFGQVIPMPVCMGMSKTATSPEKHPVLLIEFEVLYPLHLGNINASGFYIFFGIREVFRHDIASIRQRFSLWMHSGDFLCIGSDTQQGRKAWKQLF